MVPYGYEAEFEPYYGGSSVTIQGIEEDFGEYT